ncbi:MAG: efflux RND transporter periplasmic adaptor subunit [Gammaproteobacteria bacterium]
MKLLKYSLAVFAVLGGTVLSAAEDDAVPVTVARVMVGPAYEELPLTGSVTPRRLSRISPLAGGVVVQLHADHGDSVKQGDLLLLLDNELAAIDSERIAAEVREAEAGLREANRLRDKAAELLQKKHIPQTNYEASLAEVEMQQAVLERLQQEHTRQQSIVKRHRVFAPFDGVITEKFVELGEWVKTDTALFELTEIEVLRLTVPVPQHFFSRIHLGTPAGVRFDAYKQQEFQAQVDRKVPRGNDGSRTFPVLLDLDNGDGLFAPGMSARVIFQLATGSDDAVILLPHDAVIRRPDGSESVWIVDEQESAVTARRVVVRTGRQYRQQIEVTSGQLQIGDRVVVRGNERLLPEQTVSIIEEVDFKVN